MGKQDKVMTADLIDAEHFQIIDEYFNNGYRQDLAVMSTRPHLSNASAGKLFQVISKKENVKAYIMDKRQHLRAKANIEPEQIITELVNWVYADPTQFLALTPEDVKALPSEVRRCIQTVNYKKVTTYNSKGDKKETEVMDLKFIDKTKAVEMLNKMLGFYGLDNKQKASSVNVENLNINELKVLQQILTPKE